MCLFDVTGSMSTVPEVIQAKLPQLMGLLLRKNFLAHPAIMVGAIGDAYCDKYPLQIGQFESGIEIYENLTALILEGGGGGQTQESYELALYFLHAKTVHDHYEKRGEKGYIFIIGDEQPYPNVNKKQVQEVLGDTIEANIPVEEVISALRERYHIYFILPNMTHYYDDKRIKDKWKSLLPEGLILLNDPEGIVECIASQIGLVEGVTTVDTVEEDLVSFGSTATVAKAVSKALVPVGATASPKGSIQTVPDSGNPSGLATF